MSDTTYLQGLNQEQRRAVEQGEFGADANHAEPLLGDCRVT
jgi:hypothetical protein